MLALVAGIPEPHEMIDGPPLEGESGPLDLSYGMDRLVRRAPGNYVLRAGPVDLGLVGLSPQIRVEGTGLTGVGRPDGMHYLTVSRLAANGTVLGRRASGTFWYDHQWGDDWDPRTIGWSWWGLQLEDGSAAVAYVLREVGTGRILKSVMTWNGAVLPLEARPARTWRSPSGTAYPVAWDLAAGPLRLRIEPLFDDREVPVLGEMEAFWEGPVLVSGTRHGRGFQELVNYTREGA